MQTNHNCSSTFLEFILGSNTVCPGLFIGLTVLILEDVQAFFLHFCRGTFFFFFFCAREHAFSLLQNCWERSAHGHGHMQLQYTTQVVKYKTNNRKCYVYCRFNSAGFLLCKSFTAPLFLLCLYLFFFTKKKETLVLMSDMKIQHIVIWFPVCHMQRCFLVIWLVRLDLKQYTLVIC